MVQTHQGKVLPALVLLILYLYLFLFLHLFLFGFVVLSFVGRDFGLFPMPSFFPWKISILAPFEWLFSLVLYGNSS